MHEMALHSRSINNAHPANFGPESFQDGLVNQEVLSAAHISALSACLTAINGMLTTFLHMDIFSVRCLPVFNFVRVSYALVILIKLFFSANSPDSELGKVINKDDMRVEYFLDALLDKFRITAAEDRSRPAAKFLVVLVMLRSWFHKQTKVEKKDQQPPPAPAVSQSPRHGGDGPANTPLHLLSEVAAGANTGPPNTGPPNPSAPTSITTTSSTPAPRTPFTGWPIRQPPQPFFHDRAPDTSNPSKGGMPDLAAAMAPGIPLLANDQGGFTPSDMDYSLNAGFDLEALGLGLGSQDMYENGMRIAMNEPWFSDMVQAMPGGNMFTF
jgi:RalA-binding protein 1